MSVWNATGSEADPGRNQDDQNLGLLRQNSKYHQYPRNYYYSILYLSINKDFVDK